MRNRHLLLILSLVLGTPLTHAFDFDQLSKDQYEQLKRYSEQFHTFVENNATHEHVNKYLDTAFQSFRDVLAQQAWQTIEAEYITTYSQGRVDQFIERLKPVQKEKLVIDDIKTMRKKVAAILELAFENQSQRIKSDIDQSLKPCANNIKLDLAAILIGGDTPGNASASELPFTTRCIRESSRVKYHMNRIALDEDKHIETVLQAYAQQVTSFRQ